MAARRNGEISTEAIFAALECYLKLPDEESDSGSVDHHDLHTLIDVLQNRSDVDIERLMRIEWGFLDILDGYLNHLPLTLHAQMSRDPSFFVEFLSHCYRSASERDDEDRTEPTAYQRKIAEHAFGLLHDWDKIPGTLIDGTVDENALSEWCEVALSAAEHADRREVCEDHIGQLFGRVLYDAIHDPEKDLPWNAILSVSETIGTESFCSGMSCGIVNARGVTMRVGGGDLERELVEKYGSHADAIRFSAPVVAGVLDSIADGYCRDAQWWDDKQRWEGR